MKVKARSAVGAGDGFVAAMTLALAQGRDPEDAFALEAAAGTAAVLTMGRSSADAKTSSGFIKKSSGAHRIDRGDLDGPGLRLRRDAGRRGPHFVQAAASR